MSPEVRDEKQTESMSKHDGSYIGANVEKEVFVKLKNAFGQSSFKNVTIFSGWEDKGVIKKSVSREFDFIIVSGEAKKVIFFEVKRTNTEINNQLKKATSQLSEGYKFMRENIPFSRSWKFVSVVYINNDETKTKNEFILGPKSCFANFFENQLTFSSGSDNDVSYKVIILKAFSNGFMFTSLFHCKTN